MTEAFTWGERLDPLVAEFAAWTAAQGLDSESDAEELLVCGALTHDQCAWLVDFIDRWTVAQAAQDAEGGE